MSNESEQPSLILTQRLADGTVEWIPLAGPDRIPAVAGGAYALIDRADYEAPRTLVARRQDDDLVLEVHATEVLVLADFFVTADAAFHPTPDVAGGAGPFSGAPLTPASPVLADSTAGEQVVWSAGPADGATPDLAARGDSRDEAESGDGGVSPLVWGGLALAGLGLAAGAGGGGGGGGGGGSAPVDAGGGGGGIPAPAPSQNTVEGNVVGGPVIEGNGLSVEVFEGDGTSRLGEGNVDADGSFSIDVGDYSGVIILRVVDADDGADYLDEASGEPKDLNADFSAVQHISGSSGTDTTVVVNINPVTTLAARLAEREAGGGALTLALVNDSNAAVADLFGLSDLHGFPVIPINVDAFEASDGSPGETYGAILAAFSGATFNNDGDSQQTLDDVFAGLTISSSGAAELDEAAQLVLLDGARTTENETGVSITEVIARSVDTTPPQITSGATATPLDENSGAGQVVYTAEATDASAVTFSLADGGDSDVLDIDPESGEVTLLEDPDFETQSSYTFTVVATDTAGNSAELTVSLEINEVDVTPPSVTNVALTDADGAENDTLTAGDTVTVTVTMSENTIVETSGGTPQIALTIGSSTVFAAYVSGSGSTSLNFQYTVQAGDNDSNGISIPANALEANGGNLRDAAGNTADLGHGAVADNASFLVDTTAPSVNRVALTDADGAENDTLNAGDTVTVTVTMSENTIVDTSSGTPRIALNIGGDTVFANYLSGSGSTSLNFQYTVRAGDNDSNGISIPANALEANGSSLRDAAGNTADLGHGAVADNASFRVDTTAPTLTGSTPEDNADDVPVGQDIVLTFSENIRAGSGNIIISDGSDTRTIDVTDASQVSISGNTVTIDPASDLNEDSAYYVQIDEGAFLDAAGNAFAGISDTTTLNFETEDGIDTTIVVFDLIEGVSSDHSDRTFDSDVSYIIYIRVESDDADLETDGDDPGSWGRWNGAGNLGSDDRIVLVGDGDDVEGPGGNPVQSFATVFGGALWSTSAMGAAAFLQANGVFLRSTGDTESVNLWNGTWSSNPNAGETFNDVYLTTMPAGILTSQGLA